MKLFSYNSKHKVIMGLLVVFWAAYLFSGKRKNDTFDKEGHLLQSGAFKNSKNHGKWVWFYPNGSKKLEGFFDMGSREGLWLTYDTNGDTINMGYYLNDKLNGPFIKYSYGIPVDTVLYKNDVVIP